MVTWPTVRTHARWLAYDWRSGLWEVTPEAICAHTGFIDWRYDYQAPWH